MSTPGKPDNKTEVAIDVTAVPAVLSGAGQYTWSLVAALAERGDVGMTLLSRRSDRARWSAHTPGALVVGAAPNNTASRVAFGDLALGATVARRCPEARVFFGPHYTMPMRLSLPAVVTVHDLTLVEHPEWHEPLKARYFRAAIGRTARDAEGIICVSDRTAASLRQRFNVRGQVFVVPHGVDHRRFAPNEALPGIDAAVLSRLSVREPYVLHVGTVEPRKNLPGLISAFDLVAGGSSELSLVLAGVSAWGATEARRARDAARSRPRIVDLGYVEHDDLPSLLRRASVVAYPSFAEGFGLPALEALACGAPLVTSLDTVMSDVAQNAAILVDPWRPVSIAGGLSEALAGGAPAIARRATGLAVASRYTWERSAEDHVAAFVAGRSLGSGLEGGVVRAFLTGASGFVGSWLTRHLESAGDEVLALADGIDITDAAALGRELDQARPEAIYHLAALTHVGQSWEAPEETFRVNATGTLVLLEVARRLGSPPRVLLVSSAEVYGPAGGAPLTEEAPLRPVTPYAASKVAAEYLGLQAQLGRGLEVIRARPFNHVGPGQAEAFVVSALAKRIVEAERGHDREVRVGDLSPARDFTDVRDVVRAYRLLVESGVPGEVYNVSSGVATPISEVFEQLVSMAAHPVRPVIDPELLRPVDVPTLLGDCSKLAALTGWKPEIPLDQTLFEVLEDWRARVPS